MIKGVFPRLFGNFREGAILHAKFKVTTGGASPVYALKSTTAGANYNGMALTGATSALSLVLTGGARNLSVAAAEYVNIQNPATAANYLSISQNAAIVESTGTIAMAMTRNTDGALSNSVTNDEIHFILYVDK